MRLVLFDIDGTLLKAGGIVREAMGDALAQVFGTRGGIKDASFIGATDLGVVHDLMEREGFSPDEINRRFPKLIENYGKALRKKLSTWDKYEVLKGVPRILEKLKEKDVILGLVTGNCRVGALIKLERGNLDSHFTLGAYGDETPDRTEIIASAHRRAQKQAGVEIPKENVILVGDSPNDVRAAREYGIRVLAVYSGWTPREELAKLEPTWLYPDLSDTEEILRLLLS